MTIKELSQLYYLHREIERDRLRVEELMVKATNTTRVITGMPHVPGINDRMGKYAAEIADLRGIIEANIQRCFYERNRLERYINNIGDSLTRQIFTLRFVNGLSWLQVAASIGGNNTDKSVSKTCYRYLENMKE